MTPCIQFVNMFFNCIKCKNNYNTCRRFEASLINNTKAPEDKIHPSFQPYIKRDSDGAYCVKFPWKQNHPPLPTNYTICKNITQSLICRLSQDPELLHIYGKIITEQEDKGFIEKVTDLQLTKNVHYIPHHPVKKTSSTTPIRIVYNCPRLK